MDRRLTPANGHVAAWHLAGQVEAERYVPGEAARITVPVADLLDAAAGRRERQLIWGAAVTVFDEREGYVFVQAERDGYVGYLAAGQTGDTRQATHIVATPATHLYSGESFKSPDLAHLTFGSRITVTAERQKMWETPDGYIPKKHLRPVDKPFTDPVTVAQLFFGVPYLWGGNSVRGIDCSGLVQAALLACDMPCPGDSDLQRAALGAALAPDASRRRGDLYFWKGHVGLLVDADTLLHANAHHMATAYEPVAAAILRIEAQGGGPVVARKRL